MIFGWSAQLLWYRSGPGCSINTGLLLKIREYPWYWSTKPKARHIAKRRCYVYCRRHFKTLPLLYHLNVKEGSAFQYSLFYFERLWRQTDFLYISLCDFHWLVILQSERKVLERISIFKQFENWIKGAYSLRVLANVLNFVYIYGGILFIGLRQLINGSVVVLKQSIALWNLYIDKILVWRKGGKRIVKHRYVCSYLP